MSEALLSIEVVRSRVGGLSGSTIRRLIAAGDFPAPIVLSRTSRGKPARVAWVESEVTAWVERKIREARTEP